MPGGKRLGDQFLAAAFAFPESAILFTELFEPIFAALGEIDLPHRPVDREIAVELQLGRQCIGALDKASRCPLPRASWK